MRRAKSHSISAPPESLLCFAIGDTVSKPTQSRAFSSLLLMILVLLILYTSEGGYLSISQHSNRKHMGKYESRNREYLLKRRVEMMNFTIGSVGILLLINSELWITKIFCELPRPKLTKFPCMKCILSYYERPVFPA